MSILAFPGATTPAQSIAATTPYTAIASAGVSKAVSFKTTAEQQYDALKTAADSAKSAAKTAIDASLAFSPGSTPTIDYVIPTQSNAGSTTLGATVTTAAASFQPVQLANFSATYAPGSPPSASIATAPDIPSITLTPIAALSTASSLTAPASPNLNLVAPELASPTPAAVTPPAPPASLTLTLPPAAFGAAPQPLVIAPISTDGLTSAAGKFEQLTSFESPTAGFGLEFSTGYARASGLATAWRQSGTYEYLDPSNNRATHRARSAGHQASPILERLWRGRGAVRSAAMRSVQSTYANNVINRREDMAQGRAAEARTLRWAYEETSLYNAALLGVLAAVNDIDLIRLELDVDVIALKAAAEIEKVKAAVGAYNGEVAVLAAQAEAYAAQLQTYNALVSRFKAEVQAEATKADANDVSGRAFKVKAQAETGKRKAFESQLDVEKQKLDTLATKIAARGLTLSKAQIDLEKYKAAVLAHSSELVRTRGEFAAYSVKASAAAAANRTQAAKARVEAAKTQLPAQQARREVAIVEAENAKLRAEIIARTAKLQESIAKNSAAAVEAEAKAAEKTNEFSSTIASAIKNRAVAGLEADKAQAAARFSSAAAQAASQATQLSQGVNNTLANAYGALYEAVGRAAASVAAGEFSGFRVSKSVSASYNVSGTQDFSNSETQSRQTSVSEDDTYDVESNAA